MLQVVYSYWDGSGHRKTLEVRKGTTIGRFLELVKLQLIPDFHEVRSTNPEDFVYVKEDLIIPHVRLSNGVCYVCHNATFSFIDEDFVVGILNQPSQSALINEITAVFTALFVL